MTKKQKKILLLAAVAVLLLAGVGGTVAYIVAQTTPVVNTFEATEVKVVVNENKTITNKGNINAYIRAAVVATWQDTSGNVHASAPVYEVGLGSNWEKSGNFYYYKNAVSPDEATSALSVNCTSEAPADGYTLKVEILAQAIQAEPAGVVTEVWGYTPPAANN